MEASFFRFVDSLARVDKTSLVRVMIAFGSHGWKYTDEERLSRKRQVGIKKY